MPTHFYLQTKTKVGVDLLIQRENLLELVEIKGTRTLTPSLAEQLWLTNAQLKNVKCCTLVGAFDDTRSFEMHGTLVHAKPWHEL